MKRKKDQNNIAPSGHKGPKQIQQQVSSRQEPWEEHPEENTAFNWLHLENHVPGDKTSWMPQFRFFIQYEDAGVVSDSALPYNNNWLVNTYVKKFGIVGDMHSLWPLLESTGIIPDDYEISYKAYVTYLYLPPPLPRSCFLFLHLLLPPSYPSTKLLSSHTSLPFLPWGRL